MAPGAWRIVGECTWPGGGGGGIALKMGRGVPPACSKPDPVPIRLVAKRHPVPI